MSLTVLSLNDLMNELDEVNVEKLLKKFETRPNFKTGDQNDVEDFLHNKSMQFQRLGLASTYLIFAPYKSEQIIVGFFSITNKPLVISHRVFLSLSKTLQKRLNKLGTRYPDDKGRVNKSDLVIPAYLVGQIGKNFSPQAKATQAVTGTNIVALAEEKIREVIDIMNGKYVWLECQDQPRLINFYTHIGYTLVEEHISTNGLRLMIKKIV